MKTCESFRKIHLVISENKRAQKARVKPMAGDRKKKKKKKRDVDFVSATKSMWLCSVSASQILVSSEHCYFANKI